MPVTIARLLSVVKSNFASVPWNRKRSFASCIDILKLLKKVLMDFSASPLFDNGLENIILVSVFL
jgi:hypothetical protein